MKFKARTNNDRKLDINWDLVNAYLSKWKPGTVLSVEIVKRTPRKSDAQRAYYFAHVLPTFAHGLGYDPDEELLLHRQLKIVYFKVPRDKKGIYRKVPHVFAEESEQNVKQRSVFVSWVLRKAAIEGVYIES